MISRYYINIKEIFDESKIIPGNYSKVRAACFESKLVEISAWLFQKSNEQLCEPIKSKLAVNKAKLLFRETSIRTWPANLFLLASINKPSICRKASQNQSKSADSDRAKGRRTEFPRKKLSV